MAVLQDISSNGTYVNNVNVGHYERREINDGDQICIHNVATFVFRYSSCGSKKDFRKQYRVESVLGKGRFAVVHLITEKATGVQYAVKHINGSKKVGQNAMRDRKCELKTSFREVALLMALRHSNVLCLRDAFFDMGGVYLVLEFAPEGELFNWIVENHKLTEPEAHKVTWQLFQGVSYLVSPPF